jgi:glycine/betaine/sarcosine/D-proline reductase family selenoprotein B
MPIRIMMIYDQIQSGLGTKDDKNLPLGGKNGAIGPAVMMAVYLKDIDAKVMASLYCGNGTYLGNRVDTTRKLVQMVKKMNPDVVICGPSFDYQDYSMMCVEVAEAIHQATSIPTICAMAKSNAELIDQFKNKVPIVKMPGKGEPGLYTALKNVCTLTGSVVSKDNTEELMKKICY